MTIQELKKQYAPKKRNTPKAPTLTIDHEQGTLTITEHLIGGTVCVHFYKKVNNSWEYQRTEA